LWDEIMIALLGLIVAGIGSMVASVVFAFRRKNKVSMFLFGGFGLFCLAVAGIMILACAHFGEVPRC
jgi:hypothetical protein